MIAALVDTPRRVTGSLEEWIAMAGSAEKIY